MPPQAPDNTKKGCRNLARRVQRVCAAFGNAPQQGVRDTLAATFPFRQGKKAYNKWAQTVFMKGSG
jgi:hypothetical protein